MDEVTKNPSKMYRACGRMFVMAESAQLKKDLQTDLDRLQAENKRASEMNETFEAKKKALTESLNALSPKEEAK
jgi:chaperonin cofactor prefoldin